MMEIANMDVLGVVGILLLCAFVGVWMFRSMVFSRTLGQEVFMAVFMLLLGAFLESYLRGTKDFAIITAALIFLIIGWVLYQTRGVWKEMARGSGTRARSLIPILMVGLMVSTLIVLPSGADAYKTPMHEDMVDSTIQVLGNDGKQYAARYFQAEDLHGVTLLQWMKDGIADCDRLDLARNHYYNPYTEKGLTALNSADLCQQYYDQAIENYKRGDYSGSAYNLGRALHMVMDSTVPHHSANDPLNGHSEYEAWIHERQGRFTVVDGGLYGYADTAREFVTQNANVSFSLYEMVRSDNSTDVNFESVAKTIEPLAIRTSAAFLALYLDEIREIAPKLYATDHTNTGIELAWSPSADPGFVRYDVYRSGANGEIVLDEAHRVISIGERDRNSMTIDGLASYGVYQFQVVTVTSDGTLESNTVEQRLGLTAIIAVLAILVLGTAVGIAYTSNGRSRRRKR